MATDTKLHAADPGAPTAASAELSPAVPPGSPGQPGGIIPERAPVGPAARTDATWKASASFYAMYLANLFNVVNFTIVIPTSNSYASALNAGGALVGIVVGLHPFTQGLMNLPTSWALTRFELRSYLMFATCLYVLGNLV